MSEKILIKLCRNSEWDEYSLYVLKIYEVRELMDKVLLVTETDGNGHYRVFTETIRKNKIYKTNYNGVIMVVQGSPSEAFKKLHDYSSENMCDEVESKLTELLPRIRRFLNMMHRDDNFLGFKIIEDMKSFYIKNKKYNDGKWTLAS